MDAHHVGTGPQAVEGGDVAEAHHPLRTGGQLLQRQVVDKLNGAVAATVADNGLDTGGAQGPADVAEAFLHGSGITAGLHLAHIGAYHRHQPPATQHLGGLLHILHRSEIRGRNQGHRVAGPEVVGLHRVQIDAAAFGHHTHNVLLGAGGQSQQAANCQDGGHHPWFSWNHNIIILRGFCVYFILILLGRSRVFGTLRCICLFPLKHEWDRKTRCLNTAKSARFLCALVLQR